MREILPTPHNIFIDLGLPRRDHSIIGRLLIGHTKLTHSYLFTRENPPQCDYCNELLTIKHIFTECEEYLRILRSLNVVTTNITEALSIKNENIPKIIDFLKATDLYSKI